MKILILSNTLPPEGSAVAGIIDRLIPYFSSNGCTVDAITVKKKILLGNKHVYNGMTIYNASHCLFIQKVFRKLKKFGRKFLIRKEKCSLYSEYDVKAYISQLKKLDLNQYDAIIPICAYYATAESLLRYKQKYGLKVPVYLYQVDPLAYNKTFDYLDFDFRLNYERKIYDLCAAIFTTSIIFDEKKALGWNVDKIKILEFPLSNSIGTYAETNDEDIRCVFSGFLYGTIRDAKYTLELFSKFRNKNIKFYVLGEGQEELLSKYENGDLKGRLFRLGELPEKQCNEILTKADVLVNIGNKVKNQVPSKIFHYISARKPILNVACFDDCPTKLYFQKYPLSKTIVEKESVNEIDVFEVEDWIMRSKGKTVEKEELEENFKEHSPKYIVDCMLKTINVNNLNDSNGNKVK